MVKNSKNKSVFILRRGFEHIVELRRRTEAGKDLIKGRFYTAIMPRDPMQTPYQLSRSSENWGNVIVNLKIYSFISRFFIIISFHAFSLPSDNRYSSLARG